MGFLHQPRLRCRRGPDLPVPPPFARSSPGLHLPAAPRRDRPRRRAADARGHRQLRYGYQLRRHSLRVVLAAGDRPVRRQRGGARLAV